MFNEMEISVKSVYRETKNFVGLPRVNTIRICFR